MVSGIDALQTNDGDGNDVDDALNVCGIDSIVCVGQYLAFM